MCNIFLRLFVLATVFAVCNVVCDCLAHCDVTFTLDRISDLYTQFGYTGHPVLYYQGWLKFRNLRYHGLNNMHKSMIEFSYFIMKNTDLFCKISCCFLFLFSNLRLTLWRTLTWCFKHHFSMSNLRVTFWNTLLVC